MIAFLEQAFVAPWHEPFFQKALLGGTLVAVVCGIVGCLVVLRRMAFLGDALSHAMIAGIAGGYLFMKLLFGIEAHAPAMLLGSLIAAVITVALISSVSRVSRLKEDTVIGIMYCAVFAAGVVLVSIFRDLIHIDLMHFIMGDILGITDVDLWASAFVCAGVITVITLFFRHFQVTSFDPIMAASIGIPVVVVDYVLTTCVSLVVVSAVSMVGVILVVGLLITPAATAYLLSDRLNRMMTLAAFFGFTSVLGGLYLCVWLDSAGGGAIMLFCSLQFLVVLVLAPQYGLLAAWQRRRRTLPQQLLEDILVQLIRTSPLRADELNTPSFHRLQRRTRNRALARLKRDGLLGQDEEGYYLTSQGRRRAQTILRAHRLWETYLAQVGANQADIHRQAHELEHVHDQDSMDYLEHRLGHPILDPHGAPIPARPDATEPNAMVPLSMLRPGQEGEICHLGLGISDLETGQKLELVKREPDGWTAKIDNHSRIFNHMQADQIMVQIHIHGD